MDETWLGLCNSIHPLSLYLYVLLQGSVEPIVAPTPAEWTGQQSISGHTCSYTHTQGQQEPPVKLNMHVMFLSCVSQIGPRVDWDSNQWPCCEAKVPFTSLSCRLLLQLSIFMSFNMTLNSTSQLNELLALAAVTMPATRPFLDNRFSFLFNFLNLSPIKKNPIRKLWS